MISITPSKENPLFSGYDLCIWHHTPWLKVYKRDGEYRLVVAHEDRHMMTLCPESFSHFELLEVAVMVKRRMITEKLTLSLVKKRLTT